MKKLKNRWENELKTAVPALSDSVKNAAIPKEKTQSSIVKTPSSRVGNKKNIWQKRGFWAALSGGVACALALAVVLPNVGTPSGRTGTDADEMKVMNVSCNPSVEFLLDEDNVVVSANALNEEGNLVVSAETFVGMTAEEAACSFVDVAQESGFIVSGKVDSVGVTNEISIAFSGDENVAEKLFDGVRARVESHFSEKEIEGKIERAESVTEEQLKELLSNCMPHLESEKICGMDYADLMENLAKSRKETENIYSQELKTAYYEMKAFAIDQAELDAVKANADAITAAILDGIYTEYTNAISNIETFRMEYLVAEDSPYQQALAAYRAAKIEYLNYRSEVAQLEQSEISQEIRDILAGYEASLEDLKNQLLEISEAAHSELDALKLQVTELFNGINESLRDLGIDKDSLSENITQERDKVDKGFREKFETDRGEEIGAAHDRWTEMKGELKGKQHQDDGMLDIGEGEEAETLPEMESGDGEDSNALPETESNAEYSGEVPGLGGEENRDEYEQARP